MPAAKAVSDAEHGLSLYFPRQRGASWPPLALRGRWRRAGGELKGAGGPVGGNASDGANICVVRMNRSYDRTLGAMLFDVGGVLLAWDPAMATASSSRTT